MSDDTLPAGWTRSAHDAPIGGDHVALDDGRLLWIGTRWPDEALVSMTYDPTADRWDEPVPLRVTASGRAVTRTAEGWVHVSGGWDGGPPHERHVLDACELYEPETGAWLAMPPLPVACSGHAAVTVHGRVYVVGGRRGSYPFGIRTFASWAPGERAWQVHAEAPRAIDGARAIVLDDDSIVVWGSRFAGANEPDDAIRWDGRTWSAIGSIGAATGVVATAGGGLLEIGGSKANAALADVRAWSPSTGWAARPPLPKPRHHPSAVRLAGGRIAVVGGLSTERRWEDTSTGGELDLEYRSFMSWVTYDLPHDEVLVSSNDGWRAVPAPEIGRSRALVLADGRVVVCSAPLLLWTPPA